MIRIRLIYGLASVVVMCLGLASRRYRQHLPAFLAEYAGDALWAAMLFLLISVLLAGRSTLERIGITLALALSVELSQLYHAPWIDSLRQTALGGLVLGFGFLWTDLVCYAVGIGLVASAEASVRRLLRG